MRWFWVDRFVELNSGVSATAIKNVSLAEEHLHDHFPGYPVMPASLITEGLAQVGGILLAEQRQFEHMVILAKIPKLNFHGTARPGDTLVYTARIINATDEGGMTECKAHIGDKLIAEAEIMFANLSQGSADQKNWLMTMLHNVLKPKSAEAQTPA